MTSSRVESPEASPPPDGSPRAALDEAANRAIATLAGSVAQVRRASGLTLSTVAGRAGFSPAYISQIESGSANPTARTLAQVAAGLGCGVAELFGAAEGEAGSAPAFPARFAAAPLLAQVPGHSGIWDRTASGASRLQIRLVHGDPGDHGEPVRHPGEEVLVVLAGGCTVRVADIVHHLRPADVCHLAASDEHQITESSDDLLLLVVLSEE
ncbi:helix-turn-helix domain-containing protein [Streptomyces sp. NPDC002574]|uniref:helix-turn-helix domain-containing protein n=1 Tax=Streptomyces sp. NPDC002574 TaxID=3364652 RepID=UPI00368C24A0